MEFTINKTFEEALPFLTTTEYEALKRSIKEEGLRNPILVWNNTIIDGHHRYKICKELGIEPVFEEISFENEEEAYRWILKEQSSRRNQTDFAKRISIGRYYNSIKKSYGGDRKSSGNTCHLKTSNEKSRCNTCTLKNQGVKVAPLSDTEKSSGNTCHLKKVATVATLSKKTREVVAEKFGISPRTVTSCAKLAKQFDNIIPELQNRLLTGELRSSLFKKIIKLSVEEQKELIDLSSKEIIEKFKNKQKPSSPPAEKKDLSDMDKLVEENKRLKQFIDDIIANARKDLDNQMKENALLKAELDRYKSMCESLKAELEKVKQNQILTPPPTPSSVPPSQPFPAPDENAFKKPTDIQLIAVKNKMEATGKSFSELYIEACKHTGRDVPVNVPTMDNMTYADVLVVLSHR